MFLWPFCLQVQVVLTHSGCFGDFLCPLLPRFSKLVAVSPGRESLGSLPLASWQPCHQGTGLLHPPVLYGLCAGRCPPRSSAFGLLFHIPLRWKLCDFLYPFPSCLFIATVILFASYSFIYHVPTGCYYLWSALGSFFHS